MSQSKRLRAAVLASLVFLFSAFPVKRSEAFGPAAVLAVALYDAAGAVVVADAFAAGVSALIGGAIVAMAITPSNADAPVRVPLSSDLPTIDVVMPPPVVPVTASPQSVTMYNAGSLPETAASSKSAACSAVIASIYGSDYWVSIGEREYRIVSSDRDCVSEQRSLMSSNPVAWSPWSQTSRSYSTSVSSSCPSGYTLSSGSCSLTSAPRAVEADGKYDIPVPAAGSGYTAPTSSQEKDTLPGWNNMSGGTGYSWGVDSSGRPVAIEYSVSADGSKAYVRHYTQSESDSQTTVKTQSLTIDRATGQVLSGSATSAVGSIATPSTSGAAAGEVPVVTTGTVVTSGTGSDTSSISFPSDYARAGEAASAANTIKSSVDLVKDKLTDSSEVADPTIPEWADGFASAVNPLKAWSMPGHSSQCPTGGFSWNGAVYVIDSHCQLFADYWSSLQTASIVVWTIAALFIVLAA